jgi:enediyne biosynthesis protein E4
MGLDFRDFNNDEYPDLFFVALQKQTFPLFLNNKKGDFREVTTPTGLRNATLKMAGFGAGFYDFDNDGWKDIFVTRGHVASLVQPGQDVDQFNTVFRNPGDGKWSALTEQAGLDAAPAARHRGCAFGDFDGDGRVDVVATALARKPETWINRTTPSGHWIDIQLEGTRSNRDGMGARIKVASHASVQYNHMTTSVGYASSSAGPVHFGLGPSIMVDSIEIRWPSGIIQNLNHIETDRVLRVKEVEQ